MPLSQPHVKLAARRSLVAGIGSLEHCRTDPPTWASGESYPHPVVTSGPTEKQTLDLSAHGVIPAYAPPSAPANFSLSLLPPSQTTSCQSGPPSCRATASHTDLCTCWFHIGHLGGARQIAALLAGSHPLSSRTTAAAAASSYRMVNCPTQL
jgi:hypothetical protein